MADIDTESDELIRAAQVLATGDAAQIIAHIRQRFAERMRNRNIAPETRPDILRDIDAAAARLAALPDPRALSLFCRESGCRIDLRTLARFQRYACKVACRSMRLNRWQSGPMHHASNWHESQGNGRSLFGWRTRSSKKRLNRNGRKGVNR